VAREHISISEHELRRQPRRSVGQLARLFGDQQSRLRHSDLRPHQLVSLDVTPAYDPVASTAFSSLGFSAAFSGFGSSPSVRPNTAFTYRLTYQNFRAAVQAQVGGYGIGNSTNGMYQGQLGFDFGALSVDGVLSWAKDAVSLSRFAGSNIACRTRPTASSM
jgi:hypothetical protein